MKDFKNQYKKLLVRESKNDFNDGFVHGMLFMGFVSILMYLVLLAILG